MNAINISPNLNFVGIDYIPDNGSGIIASSTSQVINLPVGIATNKTFGYMDTGKRVGMQEAFQVLFNVKVVGFAILIHSHVFQSRYIYRFFPLFG